MNGLDLKTFLLALYFVTPGIVAIKARDLTVASPERNWGEKMFALLSYSAFNLLLYQLLVPAINALYSPFHWPPVLDVSALIASQSISFGSIIWLSFLLPGVFGWLTGVILKSGWFQQLLRGTIQHPQPTAWDFLFANRYKTYALIFFLKSGYKVAGLYDKGAYVSAFPQPKEIYLRKQCILGEKGEVLGVDEDSPGVFLVMDECTLMEVIPLPPAEKQGFLERNGPWQKITRKITQLSSEFRKLPSASKRLSNARDMVPLLRQTPVSSPLVEAGLFPSPNQLPEGLERNLQLPLQLQPQVQPPAHKGELSQPPVLLAREELQSQLQPPPPAVTAREELPLPSPLPPALSAREESPPPPALIPARKTEEAQ